jgi:uncharacterized protein (DUF58 family)
VKNHKIHLRPLRIFGYLVFFFLDVFLFCILRSYFLMAVGILFFVFPVLSLYCTRRLSGSISVEIRSDSPVVKCGEDALVEVVLKNKSVFLSLDCSVFLTLANVFLGTGSELVVQMPVRTGKSSRLLLPVQLVDLGRFELSCDTIRLLDWMGLVSFPVSCGASCHVDVIPSGASMEGEEISGYLSGVAETEESNKKGSDFSQVSDVREYIPGDRIRDIHWKLSAKQDSLMVKERVSVTGSEMMLLLHLTPKEEETQKILAAGYRLIQSFLAQGTDVRVLCWNEETFSFDAFACHDERELCDAFCNLYATPFLKRLQEQQMLYMKNCYPFLGTYLLVCYRSGEVWTVMQDNV